MSRYIPASLDTPTRKRRELPCAHPRYFRVVHIARFVSESTLPHGIGSHSASTFAWSVVVRVARGGCVRSHACLMYTFQSESFWLTRIPIAWAISLRECGRRGGGRRRILVTNIGYNLFIFFDAYHILCDYRVRVI